MQKNPFLLNKTLVIGILILFVGMSVVSSTGNIVEDVPSYFDPLESINTPEGLLTCDHLAYVGGYGSDCSFWEFILSDPGNLTCICGEGDCGSGIFLSCGTWTNKGVILGCEYSTGILFGLDPVTCEMWSIGGGGTSCNGLAWNPIYNRLYGTTGTELIEYDPDTGDQEFIGSHNQSGTIMIAMACDSDGSLFCWDAKFSGESYLYEIDTETGEATIVGGMGMNLCYSQDGDFCKVDDILYLAAYTNTSYNDCYLYECDKSTANCSLVGQFPDSCEIYLFAIPWNFPPNAPIIFEENGTLYVYAIDPDGDGIFFLIDWGDGTVDDWIGPYPSGEVLTINHEWSEPGTYEIRAKARDIHGAESNWSDPYTMVIENYPPDIPVINGPDKGIPNTEYEFTFNSTDQDGDDIAEYVINWGDGTGDETISGPFPSGEEVTASHSWASQETFTIKAKAKDVYGAESNWSEYLVEIPRTRATTYLWYQWLLDRFPLLERLLGLFRVI